MAIYVGSRYEFDPVYLIDCPWGNDHRHPTVFANTANGNRGSTDKQYRVHVWTDGDRMDALAYRYYGEAQRWWYIADANPDTAYDPYTIAPGTLLRIPNAAG